MELLKKTFLWGLLTAIAFLIGYFVGQWIDKVLPDPRWAIPASFTLGFLLSLALKKMGVPI